MKQLFNQYYSIARRQDIPATIYLSSIHRHKRRGLMSKRQFNAALAAYQVVHA